MSGESTFLVNDYRGLSIPSPSIRFVHSDGKNVFTITSDGLLVAGEGLSNDEASRALFKACETTFEIEWNTRAQLEAKITQLEAALEAMASAPEYDQDDALRLPHKASIPLPKEEPSS
jgi:hypothetical protein